jgi:hypothetical protein
MKTSIFTTFFFILIMLNSCGSHMNQTSIGFQDEQSFLLNNKLDSIKDNWNTILKEKKINCSLSKFEIKKETDAVNNKTYYCLIAKSENDSVKGATLLYKRNRKFYISPKEDILVFCYGCKDAYPTFEYGKWGWSCESK